MIELRREHIQPGAIFGSCYEQYSKWRARVLRIDKAKNQFVSEQLTDFHGSSHSSPLPQFETPFDFIESNKGYRLLQLAEPDEEMPKTSLIPASKYLDLLK